MNFKLFLSVHLLATFASIYTAPDYREKFSDVQQKTAYTSMESALKERYFTESYNDYMARVRPAETLWSLSPQMGGLATAVGVGLWRATQILDYRDDFRDKIVKACGLDNSFHPRPITELLAASSSVVIAGLAAWGLLTLGTTVLTHAAYSVTDKVASDIVVDNCTKEKNCRALLARFQTLSHAAELRRLNRLGKKDYEGALYNDRGRREEYYDAVAAAAAREEAREAQTA